MSKIQVVSFATEHNRCVFFALEMNEMGKLLLTILLIIKVLISVSVSRYIYQILAWQQSKRAQPLASYSTLGCNAINLALLVVSACASSIVIEKNSNNIHRNPGLSQFSNILTSPYKVSQIDVSIRLVLFFTVGNLAGEVSYSAVRNSK